jgi:signal peptidase I
MRSLGFLATGTLMIAVGCGSKGERSFRIPSSAMEPTLHCARPASGCEADAMDHVRVRPVSKLERGDIIVFEVPRSGAEVCSGGLPASQKLVYVKRLIGLPGESFSEKNGFIYINRRRIQEPYVKADRRDDMTLPARTIPADSYFVLGDFRSSSCDSRRWGPLPTRNVIGKVVLIVRGNKTIKLP